MPAHIRFVVHFNTAERPTSVFTLGFADVQLVLEAATAGERNHWLNMLGTGILIQVTGHLRLHAEVCV